MSFNDLSLGLLRKIFGYCSSSSGKDQESIAQVCHRWADAVQTPALRFSRTCLVVSRLMSRTTEFIGKGILAKSNRPYRGLVIEWSNTEPDRNMQLLEDLLDICQERFTGVEGLFLWVPPSWTLVRFFVNRRDWMKHLVELEVDLVPAASDSTGRELCEVSFPNLRQLTWREYGADGDPSNRSRIEDVENCHAFAFSVPELRELTVGMNFWLNRSNLESRQREQETCWLFLPTLELMRYENLQQVTIEGLFKLDQRCVDNSEGFLRNLRVLVFIKTDCGVIEQICEKCENLKQLIIERVPSESGMFLQISPTLSPTLEHLYIQDESGQPPMLFGDAVFLKLRRIALRDVVLLDSITLDAPQLTECDTLLTHTHGLTFAHVEPIRTLSVMISRESMQTVVPMMNVERMFLNVSSGDRWYEFVPKYLEHFPNIRLLTVFGCYCTLELSFVERLQRLEYFSADSVRLRLSDVHLLAGLKTLKLTDCTLVVGPFNTDVSLKAIQEVTIARMAVDRPFISNDRGRFPFPIRVNANQSPIVFAYCSQEGLKVFSSENVLKSKRRTDVKVTVMYKVYKTNSENVLKPKKDIKPEQLLNSENSYELEQTLPSQQKLDSKQVLQPVNKFKEGDQGLEKDIKSEKVVKSENGLKPEKASKSQKKLKLKVLPFKEENVLESEKDIKPEKVLNSKTVLKSQKKLKPKVGRKSVNMFKEEDV